MTDETSKSSVRGVGESALNRRRLLKVAVATAPAIATLSSGAALARSSNLIGPTTGLGTDAMGRTQCLKIPIDGTTGGMVDLGVPPTGHVTLITERDYRLSPQGSADTITEKQMCQLGGDYYYKSSGWEEVTVPRGIVVSATALSSFIGYKTITSSVVGDL
jgi:hypothetical protein